MHVFYCKAETSLWCLRIDHCSCVWLVKVDALCVWNCIQSISLWIAVLALCFKLHAKAMCEKLNNGKLISLYAQIQYYALCRLLYCYDSSLKNIEPLWVKNEYHGLVVFINWCVCWLDFFYVWIPEIILKWHCLKLIPLRYRYMRMALYSHNVKHCHVKLWINIFFILFLHSLAFS